METEGNNIRDLDAEDLASLARRYYAARFPNPQRIGCPPPGKIIKIVRSRHAPDGILIEHLFECSECFGEYRQALAECRPAPDEITWTMRLLSFLTSKRSATTMATVILILLSFSIIPRLVWREPASETLQIGDLASPDARVGGAGESASPPVAAIAIATIPKLTGNGRGGTWARKSSGISSPRPEIIDVDLDSYQVFRRSQREGLTTASQESSGMGGPKSSGTLDDASPGEKVISLPSTRASLVLQLPETGAPGKYNVSLIGAFGQPLLSSAAFSHDGVKLQVTLDLRRVPLKKYRLRLWRNGEAPAFYDVIIGAR
ncbi:MAG TPA: hypothetical protein VJZ77_10455 [Blastocatellia bacterium]|nr:hypothetical protein [Blastocatellia bacterium]